MAESFKESRDYFKIIKAVIVKFGLTLICLGGFLHQTKLLFADYLSGITVVSINVERIQMESLPAVTLCLPQYLSLEKVAQNNQEMNGIFTEYTDNLAKFNAGRVDQSEPDQETKNNLLKIEREMISKLSNIATLPVHDALVDYSIPIDGLHILIGGFIGKNETKDRLITFNMTDNKHNFSFIESLSYNQKTVYRKCFTVFSHLCPVSRSFKIDLRFIAITLKASHKWFPLHLLNETFLSIHSPNSLPDMLDDAIRLSIREKHFIKYNQVTTQLLNNDNKDCLDYDLNDKFANFSMRSDCITSCIQKHIRKECNIRGFTYNGYLLRKEFLEQKEQRYLPRTNENRMCQFFAKSDANFNCLKSCKPDCSFRYYSLDKNKEESLDLWTKDNKVTFIIQHNPMPDVVITYLPKTTPLSLVCNFGGLLGMWLGLSFLTISDNVISFLKLIFKRYSVFKNKNTLINNVNNKVSFNLFMNKNTPFKRNRQGYFFQ